MTELPEDTQVSSAEEVAAITGEAQEQDETGAPEKVAETRETRPIESSDEQAARAPQPGNTPAPDEPIRDSGAITGDRPADAL